MQKHKLNRKIYLFLKYINQLCALFTLRQRYQIISYVFASTISSALEITAIFLGGYLLAAVLANGGADHLQLTRPILSQINNLDRIQISALSGMLAIVILFLRLYILRQGSSLTASLTTRVSVKTFSAILARSYEDAKKTNSSEPINTLVNSVGYIGTGIIRSVLVLFANLTTILFVWTGLFLAYKNELVFITILSVILSILLVPKYLRFVKKQGQRILTAGTDQLVLLGETVATPRHYYLHEDPKRVISKYLAIDSELRSPAVIVEFLSSSPRVLIEGVVLILIPLVYYLASAEKSSTYLSLLPNIAIILLCLQRLIPSLQTCASGMGYIATTIPHLRTILEYNQSAANLITDIEETSIASSPFVFESLTLDDVSYKINGKPIISGINLTIQKGNRIGIIGPSGSGKSTLSDIISMLLIPTEGSIKINSQRINQSLIPKYQNVIQYVDQFTSVRDATLAANIVGSNKYNEERLKHVLDLAGLTDSQSGYLVEPLFQVGERGCNLSGGQLQRLSLARALYVEPQILICDEFTSALDRETELKIVNTITHLSRSITVIMVTHRSAPLSVCDTIYELPDGKLFTR